MALQLITDETMRDRAPAVFTKAAAPHLSDRYGFYSTIDIINVLRDEGYQPIKAQQDRATRRDPRFVRHTVSMAHQDAFRDQRNLVVGEVVPTINIVNSHNGRTMFNVNSGMFRLVCSNGLMVADKGHAEFERMRHAASLVDDVIARMRSAAARVTEVTKQIEGWREVELTEAQANDYALRAATLRFGAAAVGAYKVEDVLEVRREEDDGRSLWRVMNRVQENLSQGGIVGATATGRRMTSRAITGITGDHAFNKSLWTLTEEFA